MIVRKIPSINMSYGKYFLASEAEDDEEYQPKANTKVINIRPNSGHRTDFSNFINDEDDVSPEETQADTTSDDSQLEGNEDNTTPEENQGQEVPPDDTSPVVTGDDVNQNPDYNTDEGDNMDFDSDNPDGTEDIDDTEDFDTDDGTDAGGDAAGEEDPDDTQDFGDAAGDEEADTQAETPEQEGDPNQQKGPGLEYDSTRKYNLFKEYMTLAASINNYISKLEDNMSDNIIQNQAIKIATDRLHEIYNLCVDYMLLNFEANSYTKSILFYQMLKAAIQKVFKLLSKGQEISKSLVE